MSNRMRWYIIGNIIGLLLLALAIAAKEGKLHMNSNPPPETQSQ
jgi:hypothetical protein